jgi:hypothetical protein
LSPNQILRRTNTKKALSLLLLGLFFFFWAVLAFHCHPDGRARDECPLCRLSFQFSSFVLASLLSIFLAPSALILEAAKGGFLCPLILTHSLHPRAPPAF